VTQTHSTAKATSSSCRALARAIRALATTLKGPEARDELLSLAAHYDELAAHLETRWSLAMAHHAAI
jgi:hypothetical protein